MNIIQLSNVTVEFSGKKILDNVSLVVREGEKILLQGPSGSGKSTLLLTLMGVNILAAGDVKVLGKMLSPALAGVIRQSVCYISQEPVLGADMAEQALMFPFKFRANRERKPNAEKIRAMLNKVKLDSSLLHSRSKDLSGGEKQKLIIARALLMGKKIFLLDEITSALDEENKNEILNIFSTPEYTVLAVSHDSQWKRSFLTHISLNGGKIIVRRSGPLEEIVK